MGLGGKPRGGQPEFRRVKEVKPKKNITQEVLKLIETVRHYILHTALTNKEILIHENTFQVFSRNINYHKHRLLTFQNF